MVKDLAAALAILALFGAGFVVTAVADDRPDVPVRVGR
jgi:hypothetical protein